MSSQTSLSDSERNKLRVVVELLFDDLSWSDLHKKTHIGKNSLSRALEALRDEKAVVEEISRKRETSGRPRIIYHLEPNDRKRYEWLLEPAREIKKIQKLVEEYSDLFFERARGEGGGSKRISKDQVEKLLREYLTNVTLGFIVILETELLREHIPYSHDSFLSSLHTEAMQDVLWNTFYLKDVAQEIKADMDADRKENLKKLERELDRLKKQVMMMKKKDSGKVK